MFSENDKTQISNHGLDLEKIDYQIEKFKSGFPSTVLRKPAIQGDGLHVIDEVEIDRILEEYESILGSNDIVKFVPASGAATRMFKTLFAFLGSYEDTEEDYEKLLLDQSAGSTYTFLKGLENFAFYDDLKKAYSGPESLEEGHLKRKYKKVVSALLEKEGLNYGSLPKGLLKFHSYAGGNRTPVEEHIVEGAQYAKKADRSVRLHFTVSPDHLDNFKAHISEVRAGYENQYDVQLEVSYSIQKPSTDTIAVDLQNEPFRNSDDSLLFRPAGHGALLENLNDIDSDIVFLKNIDNVVPDSLKEETIRFKKVIAGLLVKYREQVVQAFKKLSEGTGIEEARALLLELGFSVSDSQKTKSTQDQIALLKSKLNRPIRVCGMVKSDGDPGGGPFWVESPSGDLSLQVVETAQIDLSKEDQKAVFNQATHFNPVDVVCFLKDVNGEPFNLIDFRDPDTGFITQKSKDGKDLKAQELPGLWNGAMADWNTLFVEVPPITFNPVKSVNDLLKKEHQ